MNGSHEHAPVGHTPSHSHAPANFGRTFAIGIGLNLAFVILEAGYGLVAHSLSLVADAGHNLSDVFGLLLAWGATAWGRRAPTLRHTYGWRRSSVLAALANAIFLLVSVGVIAWEALRRLESPAPVGTQAMIWVASVGIVVNAVTAWMFRSGHQGDLNIRGAYLHMAADAIISAGVVATGVIITYTGWRWLDPVVSLIVGAIIVAGTWGLLRDSLNLSLDAVPEGIDLKQVHEYLGSFPAVTDVHHLHIWGLSTSEVALTVHVRLAAGGTNDDLLRAMNSGLEHQFGIGHATIQFESDGAAECVDGRCGKV